MTEKKIQVLGGLWEIPADDIPFEAASKFVKLPSLADRLRKYDGSARNLPTAEGLADLRQMIEQHAEFIAEKLSRDRKGGWYRVKVKKGKDDDPAAKTVKCSISCRYDLDGIMMMPCAEVRLHVATFRVPRSLLHEEALDCYCPAWAVHKGLEETKRRSPGRMDKVTRIPAEAPCWPPALKARWIRLHLESLPTLEVLEAVSLERERETAQSQAEAQQVQERARLAREKAEAERKADEEKARAKKEKRRESMECRKCVNIRWKEWTRKGGKYVSEVCEAEGVDLYFSGDRTYIVFPDGDELIRKAANVEITGTAAEEVTETSSFGQKEDGTPRKAKAGPGRPRVYSPEEAAERRRKCRERWKEENKEKMLEYRKAWRERQKAKTT